MIPAEVYDELAAILEDEADRLASDHDRKADHHDDRDEGDGVA
jgi:hypothetical protein